MTRLLADLCAAALQKRSLEVDAAEAPHVYALAVRHGVGPLVFPLLAAGLSGEARHAVRQQHARTLQQIAELLRVCQALDTVGIESVVLKGPVLSQQLYDDPARRVSLDLDILLRFADLEAACRALEAHGLIAASPAAAALHDRRRYDNQIQLHSVTGHLLELQWEWAEPHLSVRASVPDTIRQGVYVAMGHQHVRTLEPARLLAYLALHGAKHGWCRFDLVCDYAAALSRFGHRYGAAEAYAAEAGLARILRIATLIARNLFGLDIAVTGERRAEELAAQYGVALLNGRPVNATSAYMRSRDNTRDRLRSLSVLALNPSSSDRAWINLPERLFPLYYLLRPVRLFSVGVQRTLHFLP